MHHADGLPAFFTVLDPVLPGQTEGIAEDMRCFLEGDSVMFFLVGVECRRGQDRIIGFLRGFASQYRGQCFC